MAAWLPPLKWRVQEQAFSALKQFEPDELREQLPKYFSLNLLNTRQPLTEAANFP